jgi:hypothetical protein
MHVHDRNSLHFSSGVGLPRDTSSKATIRIQRATSSVDADFDSINIFYGMTEVSTHAFLGVNALVTVLPVFEMERNMLYRHNKASLMYNHNAVTLAFTIVEILFIFIAGLVSL